MKKLLLTFTITLSVAISSFSQVESLAGPRLGVAFITASPTSGLINAFLDLDALGDLPLNFDSDIKGAITSLYGWQWESRFADGGDITGIVEWIALIGGMEKGLFLPSISSMVGARTSNGLEFAMGPNLSLGGIAMVFGCGYNFKSGNLNMPVNFGFVPGRKNTQDARSDYYLGEVTPEIQYNTGNRFSITVGFNMSK